MEGRRLRVNHTASDRQLRETCACCLISPQPPRKGYSFPMPGRVFVLLIFFWLAVPCAAAGFSPGVMGEVVTTRGDETLLTAARPAPQVLVRGQTLSVGDEIRTGPYGGAAILFRDGTLMRLHRNSRLEVGEVRDAAVAQSRFRLLAGAVWARARTTFRAVTAGLQANRPTVLQMDTPAATIGIRGTDWHVAVDGAGKTVLTVLEGQIDFGNTAGQLLVASGERGVAEPGKPPRKVVVVDLKGKPLLAVEISLRWFEWLRMTEVSTHAAMLAEDARLEAIPEAARTPEDWLALAQTRFDRMLPEAAAAALAQAGPAAESEAGLLTGGVLHARAGDAEAARLLLNRVVNAPSPAVRLRAGLALAGLEFGAKRYPETRRALRELAQSFPERPEVALYQIVLTFFAGDYARLKQQLADAEARFPAEARFAAVAAAFARVEGDDARLRDRIERALALDPEDPVALTLRGDYYTEVAPDQVKAAESYAQVLAKTRFPETLNNLGLFLGKLGEVKDQRQAYLSAMAAAPDNMAPRVNLALLYLSLDRLDDAREILAGIDPDDPVAATARLAEGLILLAEGQADPAVEMLDRAVLANPGTLESYTALTVAKYQQGNFAAADSALAEARRADPDDPIPLILSSVIAQDQARIGEAIRYSRRALRQIRRLGSFAVEDIANTRSGASNVGSAYATLGLKEWGRYYTQRTFSPYDASGHLLLSNIYGNARARAAEVGQGLLLDPLAIAGSNRYYDFVRRPAHYLSVGGSGGNVDGAQTDSASGTLQGFLRLPEPMAYAVTASRTNDDGFRSNSDQVNEQVVAAFGTRLNDQQDQISALFLANRAAQDDPGPVDAPDPDDEDRVQSFSGTLGWQHRFSYTNRIIARASAASINQREGNARPFGFGLDPIAYGLVDTYGLDTAKALVDQGLFDLRTLSPETPLLVLDTPANARFCAIPGFCDLRYAPELPASFDSKRYFQREQETHQVDLQARHLFDPVPGVSVSWGAEWTPQDISDRELGFAQRELGTTLLVTDFEGFFLNQTDVLLAPFGPAEAVKSSREGNSGSTHAFAQVQWRNQPMQPSLALEAGVSWRDYDGRRGETSAADPRVGLAWSPRENHWLRSAYQRELGMPRPLLGTIAPVGVNGLVPGDRLPLFDGEILESGILRWDAEWAPGLFTSAQVERQEIEDFFRLDELSLGVNSWFRERFGMSFVYRLSDSTLLPAGPARGNHIPLLAPHEFDAGLTYIHPRQVQVGIVGRYVGERFADSSNEARVDDYFTLDVTANWQPLQRRWALGMTLSNLLDSEHDTIRGYPAPGIGVALSVERRF